jgi:hypothetical protein
MMIDINMGNGAACTIKGNQAKAPIKWQLSGVRAQFSLILEKTKI